MSGMTSKRRMPSIHLHARSGWEGSDHMASVDICVIIGFAVDVFVYFFI